MGRKRRKFTGSFKAQVELNALRGGRTIQEIATKHNLMPTQVSAWQKQVFEGMADVFAKGESSDERKSEFKELDATIGRLGERFFPQNAQAMSPGELRSMIQPDHPKLSLSAQ